MTQAREHVNAHLPEYINDRPSANLVQADRNDTHGVQASSVIIDITIQRHYLDAQLGR